MTLTLYGSPRSRTMRVLWLLAELDLEFEHVPFEFDDPRLKSAWFLALNPAGAIPTLVDDGFALSESLAINLYLARRYAASAPPGFCPASPGAEADAIRWSLFAQGHLEPWIQQDRLLAGAIAALGDHAKSMVDASLRVLEATLAQTAGHERAGLGRAWLGREHFSVADLNVAGVLSPSRSSRLDLRAYARVEDWLARCYARPACRETRRRHA